MLSLNGYELVRRFMSNKDGGKQRGSTSILMELLIFGKDSEVKCDEKSC
jgi:hypothetical protein